MKFAHDFKDSLAREDFPSHWVKHAIPYSQLKKCLKKVQRELNDLGLDTDTLRSLLDPNTTSPVALQYRLKTASDSNLVQPKLTVNVQLQDGVVVDASLTTSTRRFFEKIATDLPELRRAPLPLPSSDTPSETNPTPDSEAGQSNADSTAVNDHDMVDGPVEASSSSRGAIETIEVPLVFDSEFFDMLQNDVHNLDALQTEEQKNMEVEITKLSKDVSRATRPSRFSKSDMATWRDIFELYLDAQVFFATNERDHGNRSSTVALKQLQWFQKQVETRHLAQHFTVRESAQAFSRFMNLNANLLKNLQFQELNKLAIYKILKKFDKRTSLGVSGTFPTAIRSDKLLAGKMAQDVCAQMSQQLVAVVPQLNDYLCPVCFSIAYRPVRLECEHVFCIRCVIKIQRRKEKHCPLCRSGVVMEASADNLDRQLEKYLRKNFPQEVKEKQRANEMERGIEDYGPDYKPSDCTVM